MRVLGIDPGSLITGYGVVALAPGAAPGSVSYVECGVIRPKAPASLEARLAEISRTLGDVIAELGPDVVAVEDVFHSVNARSALALGQARGAILAAVGLAGLEVHAYPPATVKKAVTGQGRADKAQVGRMVCALLGLRREPQVDASDALAIALTHLQHARARAPRAPRRRA